jgi:hypothetical protein
MVLNQSSIHGVLRSKVPDESQAIFTHDEGYGDFFHQTPKTFASPFRFDSVPQPEEAMSRVPQSA